MRFVNYLCVSPGPWPDQAHRSLGGVGSAERLEELLNAEDGLALTPAGIDQD
jgi:hypothetical protein